MGASPPLEAAILVDGDHLATRGAAEAHQAPGHGTEPRVALLGAVIPHRTKYESPVLAGPETRPSHRARHAAAAASIRFSAIPSGSRHMSYAIVISIPARGGS